MPNLNYPALWFWMGVAQWILTLAIWIYVWWGNREKVTAGKFASLEKEVAKRVAKIELEEFRRENKERLDRHRVEMIEMEKRLLKMESDICHLPGQSDMRNLVDRIGVLQGSLSEFSGKLSGVNRAVDLINQFLIEKGLKAE